jgi:tetratricopeptide (TPR) repeat protein
LFNYGHTLHKIGKYEESNKILFKAQELSNDVMILNIIGKNFFEMKDYEQSKFYLRRSMRILPNRIYSVYLLYNVIYQEYFETYNINLLADLDELARIVLNTKFKIENSKTSKFRDAVLQKHLELRK